MKTGPLVTPEQTSFSSSCKLKVIVTMSLDGRDRGHAPYVVNFRDNKMLKVDPKGFVAPFATISKKGLGHLCFKEDRFYVTAFESHEIYEVTLDGTVKRILGNGNRGVVDGAAANARLSFPNEIAYSRWGRRLYINEYVNDSESSLPRRAIVREITLEP